MPRDDMVYVSHMLDMSKKAVEITSGKDRLSFDQDETLQLALTHIIQILG